MSTSTRSKRSATQGGGEAEPAIKKLRDEEGEPIPVEEAAASEGVLTTETDKGEATTPNPTSAGGASSTNKRGLSSQIDLTNKSPTDPSSFNDYLFALLAHKAENNNFHASREENPNLHVWLQHLKREYKNYLSEEVGSTLTEVQVKVLENLHVPLTSRGDDHWNRFYQLLLQYADRHGHVLVPRLCEIPGLGDWVTDQRRQYKAWKQGQASQLTRERREKLESIGFAWQVRNRPEWEARFAELLEYKKKHGDCKVPQHYKDNKALGKWVAKQREQHKLLKKGQHSFLTPYRLEKLNNVGFVWSVRSSLDTSDAEGVKLPPDTPGVLPAAAAPAAAAAAAAIAAAKEESEPKQLDVPEEVKKEERVVTEI